MQALLSSIRLGPESGAFLMESLVAVIRPEGPGAGGVARDVAAVPAIRSRTACSFPGVRLLCSEERDPDGLPAPSLSRRDSRRAEVETSPGGCQAECGA